MGSVAKKLRFRKNPEKLSLFFCIGKCKRRLGRKQQDIETRRNLVKVKAEYLAILPTDTIAINRIFTDLAPHNNRKPRVQQIIGDKLYTACRVKHTTPALEHTRDIGVIAQTIAIGEHSGKISKNQLSWFLLFSGDGRRQ